MRELISYGGQDSMHTFEGKNIRIHYNSDMSGECDIIEKNTEQKMTVPCNDILDFVANYVRRQEISMLEDMDTEDILNIKKIF